MCAVGFNACCNMHSCVLFECVIKQLVVCMLQHAHVHACAHHLQAVSPLFSDQGRHRILGQVYPPLQVLGEPDATNGWFNKAQALCTAVLRQEYGRAHYLARTYYSGPDRHLASL